MHSNVIYVNYLLGHPKWWLFLFLCFLQGLVNRALINMAKQLYYSELHLKDNEIYLSKLYISRYYEVQDVIKYT